jgi:type IV pilus assembly protein PilA
VDVLQTWPSRRGFTLLEMLVVLGIIAILSMMALPSFEPTVPRRQVLESTELIEDLKKVVRAYHQISRDFPKENVDAGIPRPESLLGNYIDRIELNKGAFHLRFGMKAHPSIKGKILTVRPILVRDSPDSPISWLCGYSSMPEGMYSQTDNRTSVEAKFLPFECRR